MSYTTNLLFPFGAWKESNGTFLVASLEFEGLFTGSPTMDRIVQMATERLNLELESLGLEPKRPNFDREPDFAFILEADRNKKKVVGVFIRSADLW